MPAEKRTEKSIAVYKNMPFDDICLVLFIGFIFSREWEFSIGSGGKEKQFLLKLLGDVLSYGASLKSEIVLKYFRINWAPRQMRIDVRKVCCTGEQPKLNLHSKWMCKKFCLQN